MGLSCPRLPQKSITFKGIRVQIPSYHTIDEWQNVLNNVLNDCGEKLEEQPKKNMLHDDVDVTAMLKNINLNEMYNETPSEQHQRIMSVLEELHPFLFKKEESNDDYTMLTACTVSPEEFESYNKTNQEWKKQDSKKYIERELKNEEKKKNLQRAKQLRAEIANAKKLQLFTNVSLGCAVVATITGLPGILVSVLHFAAKHPNVIGSVVFGLGLIIFLVAFFFALCSFTKLSERADHYRREAEKSKSELYKDIGEDILTDKEKEDKLKLREIEDALGVEFAEEYQKIKAEV